MKLNVARVDADDNTSNLSQLLASMMEGAQSFKPVGLARNHVHPHMTMQT
jgi:hypothetical protein